MTLGIAIIVILLLGIVGLGLLLLLVGGVMLWMRGRSMAPAPAPAPSPRPAPRPPAAAPTPVPVAAPPRRVSSSPPAPAPSADAPPLASNSGLLGFFDDEAFMASTSKPREGESAKTELFQRGKMAIDWDDEEDEGEATEIFSAHGAAGDLAEFAFDDDDQSTGRFGGS